MCKLWRLDAFGGGTNARSTAPFFMLLVAALIYDVDEARDASTIGSGTSTILRLNASFGRPGAVVCMSSIIQLCMVFRKLQQSVYTSLNNLT